MMTSGTSAQADYGDALFGADGTAEPLTEVRPVAVFADPLADPGIGPDSRVRPALPPDPSTRVAQPPPISDEARRLAERQLAARQRGGRNPQKPQKSQQSQQARESQQARQSQPAQPTAPVAYPDQYGARSFQAPASSPAPVSSTGDPGADRRQLMEQIRAAKGPDRKQLIQRLLTQGRAERIEVRSRGAVADQAGAAAQKKGRAGGGLAFLVLLVILLVTSGAGREIVDLLSDLFSRGN